ANWRDRPGHCGCRRHWDRSRSAPRPRFQRSSGASCSIRSLAKRPPSGQRVHLSYNVSDIEAHTRRANARFATTTIGGHAMDHLSTISAVVLGGPSLFGGIGSIAGTVIGVFIPIVLLNGFVILGIPPFWQTVAMGRRAHPRRLDRPAQT